MKKLLLLILFPMAALAITEQQFASFKNDRSVIAAACQEDAFLRNCYNADQKNCFEQVKKSYDGCVKFLQKHVTTKITADAFEKKLDSCLIRDIDIQWKEKTAKRTPACALPPKETL